MPYLQALKPPSVPPFLIPRQQGRSTTCRQICITEWWVAHYNFCLHTTYIIYTGEAQIQSSSSLTLIINFYILGICAHSLKSLILLWGWSFEIDIPCLFPKKTHSVSSLLGMYLRAGQGRGLGVWLLGIQIFIHYPVFSPVTHCSLSLFFQESYLTQCLRCELADVNAQSSTTLHVFGSTPYPRLHLEDSSPFNHCAFEDSSMNQPAYCHSLLLSTDSLILAFLLC